jgi:replicative DNA helicase
LKGDIGGPFNQAINGISTGFSKLDEMTGGLHAGELVILAARTSMGKTASH